MVGSMSGDNPTNLTVVNFPKTAALLQVLAPVVLVIGAWFSLRATAESARDIAIEARGEARAATNASVLINIRLERIQTILERMDQGFADKVKAEVRAALRAAGVKED